MPRKKKTAAKKVTGPTYYKAKNGRFYKKVVIDGKTRCRFVSNAEATGTIKAPKQKSTKMSKEKSQTGSKSQLSPPPPKQKRQRKKKESMEKISEDAELVES